MRTLSIAAFIATFALLMPAGALARGQKQQDSWGKRVSTWLNPVRYHSSRRGRSLVEYGLENGRRVTLGSTRQLPPSKRFEEGAMIQTVYGRLRVDGRSHPSRLRTIRTPDGLAKHTLVVRGFAGGEVKRLEGAGFDTSTIKAGTMKLNWQESNQPYKPLTATRGVGKMVLGSKITRAAALATTLGVSAWTLGLLHTAQAAVSLKLASMASEQQTIRKIGAITDFRPRGVPQRGLSTHLPGISDAVSSMKNLAP